MVSVNTTFHKFIKPLDSSGLYLLHLNYIIQHFDLRCRDRNFSCFFKYIYIYIYIVTGWRITRQANFNKRTPTLMSLRDMHHNIYIYICFKSLLFQALCFWMMWWWLNDDWILNSLNFYIHLFEFLQNKMCHKHVVWVFMNLVSSS